MNALNTFLHSPLPKFADALAECRLQPAAGSSSRSLIIGIIVLCLLPRVLLACMLEAACSDGYYYIAVADALERGDMAAAFSYLNLNVYPAILLLLHRAGLEWVFAAKLWGVAIGGLTVLPLFGWVRRMFDDRIAVIACLLYAAHPKAIEQSVEPIRETTFWFFAMLFLYLALRAVVENKLWLFASAGVAMTLAIHTRSEGWILVVAVLAWTAFRIRRQTHERLKLMAGLVVCLAILPGLLFVTNVTVLRHHAQWEWGRLGNVRPTHRRAAPVADSRPPAARIAELPILSEQSEVANPPTVAAKPAAHPADAPTARSRDRISVKAALRTYLEALYSTYKPLAIFLTLVGLYVARGDLFHRDKLLLWTLAPVVLAAVWVRLLVVGNLNGRYFLTAFFLLAPFMAIGQLMLLRWLNAAASRLGGAVAAKRLSPTVMLFLIVCGCWFEALTFDHARRKNDAALGRWLRSQIAHAPTVLVDVDSSTVGYYAQSGCPRTLLGGADPEDVLPITHPDLMIIDAAIYTAWSREYREIVKTACASQGLERIRIDDSLRARAHYVVFGAPKRQPRDLMDAAPIQPIPSQMRSAARD